MANLPVRKRRKPIAGKRQPRERHALKTAARGYGRDWQKLSRAYRAAHPLCETCEQEGIDTLATEVDHVEPFEGVDDPRRLNLDNLRALCHKHHAIKTLGGR